MLNITPEWIESMIERVPFSGCWIWMGRLNDKGYGLVNENGKGHRAHRVIFEAVRGPIGSLFSDHTCRVRCCVNPDHIEPVTNKINVLRGVGPTAFNARKEFCKNGHRFDRVDVKKTGRTERKCLTCHNARALRSAIRMRAIRASLPAEKEKGR